MSKHGYITFYVVGLMAVVTLLALIIFVPINNEGIMIRNNIKDIDEFYKEQAGLERLISIYSKNISYSKDTTFNDLGVDYKLQDISIKQQNVLINTGNQTSRIQVPFYVNNHTIINIYINCGLITLDGCCYVTIYAPSGQKIVSESITENRSYEISNIYDPVTDTWGYGYGEYIVEINPLNSYASVSISYNKITERIVKIIDVPKKAEFAFKITNNERSLNSVSKILLEGLTP